MLRRGTLYFFLIVAAFAGAMQAQAQESPVSTGVPFLLLGPDARTGGVADAATGLTADAASLHTNAAKILFAERNGIVLSYTPWMRQLVSDAHFGYLSGYRHMNDREALGVSVKFLDLGAIEFRDASGVLLQNYQANEFSVDGSYVRKLGENFSMGLTARYIHSDLGSGNYGGLEQRATGAVAADLSLYYETDIERGEYDKRFAWGITLSNVGTKLQYSDNEKTFLPMNLRLGAGYSFYADPENRLTLLLDVNKVMAPTAPRYNADGSIAEGKDPGRSVASALFSSMFDAPGGFREELSEFTIAAGMEYSYFQQLFFRAGYFYEDPDKGNRQHFAIGAGLAVKSLRFDFSYLMPTGSRFTLKKTAKFSMAYAFGGN